MDITIFRNFNIYASSAANLVYVERALSEKLSISLCLFFVLVKMADRGHSKGAILKSFNGNFYKLGEWLYHLYEFHLNWFKCR